MSAIGFPKRVMRSGLPVFRTRSRAARHVALNFEIGMLCIAVHIYTMVRDHGPNTPPLPFVSDYSPTGPSGTSEDESTPASLQIVSPVALLAVIVAEALRHSLSHLVAGCTVYFGSKAIRARSAPTHTVRIASVTRGTSENDTRNATIPSGPTLGATWNAPGAQRVSIAGRGPTVQGTVDVVVSNVAMNVYSPGAKDWLSAGSTRTANDDTQSDWSHLPQSQPEDVSSETSASRRNIKLRAA